MERINIYKYFIVFVIGSLVFVAFLITRDYLKILLSSVLIAYIALPLKRVLDRKFPDTISSLCIIVVMALVLFLVVSFFSAQLVMQLGTYLNQQNINQVSDALVKTTSAFPQLKDFVSSLGTQVQSFVASFTISVASNLPKVALSVFLTFFITYFLLLDWDKTESFILNMLPLKREDIHRIGDMGRKIIYGYSIIAVLEFFISLAGFFIAGTKIYLVLALLIGVSVFIPIVGPFVIWGIVFLIYLFSHNYFSATVVLLMGLVLTIGIDHFVAHIIVGNRSKIHPVIMIIGVLGGIPLFGILGFILGPLTLVVLIEIIKNLVIERELRFV